MGNTQSYPTDDQQQQLLDDYAEAVDHAMQDGMDIDEVRDVTRQWVATLARVANIRDTMTDPDIKQALEEGNVEQAVGIALDKEEL